MIVDDLRLSDLGCFPFSQGQSLRRNGIGHSGEVVADLTAKVCDGMLDRLDGFDVSKGTIRFSAAHPIPDDVLSDIVRARLEEITGA